MTIYKPFDARYNDLSDPATVSLTAAVCNGVSHSQTTYDILNYSLYRHSETSQTDTCSLCVAVATAVHCQRPSASGSEVTTIWRCINSIIIIILLLLLEKCIGQRLCKCPKRCDQVRWFSVVGGVA